jgi:hypothetical protein
MLLTLLLLVQPGDIGDWPRTGRPEIDSIPVEAIASAASVQHGAPELDG